MTIERCAAMWNHNKTDARFLACLTMSLSSCSTGGLELTATIHLVSIHKKGICRRSVSGKAVATIAGLLLDEVIVDVIPFDLVAHTRLLGYPYIAVAIQWVADLLPVRWGSLVIQAWG